MTFELTTVDQFGLAKTASLLNQGFSDYSVPIHLTEEALFRMVRQDSVDIFCSQVILQDGKALGAALISRRGWTSRLAGMAFVPEARRRGAGRMLLDRLLEAAQVRGDHVMTLEVIEHNTVAIHLYQSCGFTEIRRLVGYRTTELEAVPSAELEEIDIRELARLVVTYGAIDLPWQISGESLAQAGPPNRAFRLNGAHIGVSDPEHSKIAIRSLLVIPEVRLKGRATRLLHALSAHFPNRTWIVPALCPEGFGPFFVKCGFEQDALSQLQMQIAL